MTKFHTVNENILTSNLVNVIVHGCNCSGAFGSGVAGQIARMYPVVREQYLSLYNYGGMYLGEILPVGVEDKIIVNAFTQKNYGIISEGPYVSYAAIKQVAKTVFLEFSNMKIGFPKIGAGLAGGNWEIIREIIEKEAIAAKIPEVWFFEYKQ